MTKFVIHRILTMGALCACCAFGQGTFGQIAYGGCLQTTFTLFNTSASSAASVSIFFYADNGTSLSAPVQGVGSVSSYQFTIPANGGQDVVLANTDANTTQGWANMTTANGVTVRGQGRFLCHNPGGPDFEAVVPLSTSTPAECIVGFPPTPNPVILVPFDNTTYGSSGGQHLTALALANTTSAAIAIPVEFDDATTNAIVKDTLHLAAMNHTAFAVTTNYPALIGKKGILRIFANTANLSVLALLFNNSGTGAFTTIMPVTQ